MPSATSSNTTLVCSDAATRAEQEQGLPPGLLLAIGRQESGRWDAGSGQLLPWPFSVNAAGESRFFQTELEAVSFVAMRQATGVQSIDVGCFQINLKHHPTAFANLDEAFDPEANARYAARFLANLHRETGSWEAAIGRYHSATFALGESYRVAVLSRWSSGRAVPGMGTVRSMGPWREVVAGVTVQRPGAVGGQPYALRLAPNLPHVITPAASGILMANGSSPPGM